MKPLEHVDDAKNDPKVAYAVTERPGKDKSGRLIRDENGDILSDLPEIATFIKKKASFLTA